MAIIVPILSSWNPTGLNKAIADVKRAQNEFQQISAATGFIGDSMTKMGQSMTRNVTVPILGLAYASKQATDAAIEDQKSQQALAKTMQNVTGATQAQTDAMEKFITKTQLAFGVADTALRPALSNLIRVTGDTTKSQKLLNLSLDVAAGTGRDVESVSLAISKAYAGNLGALTRLGVAIPDNIKKSKDFGKVQEYLNGLFGGQAAAAADTYAGRMAILKQSLSETQETIGYALLPVITSMVDYFNVSVMPAIQSLVKRFQELNPETVKTAAKILAISAAAGPLLIIVGKLFTAISSITGVLGKMQIASAAAATGTQAASAGLMSVLGPIALVVAAIAGAIAIFVALWRESEVFRNAVTSAIKVVKDTLLTAFDSITTTMENNSLTLDTLKNAFKTLGDFIGKYIVPIVQFILVQAIGLVTAAINTLIPVISFVVKAFMVFIDVVSNVIDWVMRLFQAIGNIGSSFMDVGRQIVDGLRTGIANAWGDFKNWFRGMMGQPIQWAKEILRIKSPSQVFQGIGENVVAGYIKGVEGMTSTLQNTMQNMAIDSTVAVDGKVGVVNSGGAMRTGNTYNLTVNAGMGADGAAIGKQIVDAIKRYERATGPIFASA